MSKSSWLSTVLNPPKDEPDFYIPTPKTPKKHNLSRDDRLRIQTLYLTAGWSKDDIALQLNVTRGQIRYALAHQLTPQKQRSGRRPLLGREERKRLIEWVCASAKNRRTPWHKIPTILD
jgi:transposase